MMTRAVCRSASGARGERIGSDIYLISRDISILLLWGALRLPCTRGYAFESSTDTCHYVPTALWYCMTECAGSVKNPAVSRQTRDGRPRPETESGHAGEPGRERSDPH